MANSRPEPILLALASLSDTVLSRDTATARHRFESAERTVGTDLSRHPIQEVINSYLRLDDEVLVPADFGWDGDGRTWGDMRRMGGIDEKVQDEVLDQSWRAVTQVGSPPLPFARILRSLGYWRGVRMTADDVARLRTVTEFYNALYEVTDEDVSGLTLSQKLIGYALHHHTLASRHTGSVAWAEADGA